MLNADVGWIKWLADGKRFLLMWLCAPLVALGQDNPEHMIWLRLQMAAMWLVTLGALGALAARLVPAAPANAAAATALLATLLHPLLWSALEIRPDSAAICMMSLCLALLAWAPALNHPRRWSVAAGALAALACSASLKALVYGAPLALVAAIALLRPNQRDALPHPLHFTLGFGAIGAATLLATLVAGSLDGYWHGFYLLAKQHETLYPELDPWRLIRPVLRQHTLHTALTIVGLSALLEAMSGRDPQRRAGPALALLAVWCGAWASYLVQRGAYDYSLIPALALSCVIAGAGLARLHAACAPHIPRTSAWSAAALCVALLSWQSWSAASHAPTNTAQRAVHAQIEQLTDHDDVVYDMSSTFVYRPRAHELEFLDRLRKEARWKELQHSIPESIIKNESVMFVMDSRFADFKKSTAGRFLLNNYQKFNDDLRIWGRSWSLEALSQPQRFLAITSDEYFFYPEDILDHADVFVNDKKISTSVITLTRGEHRLRVTPRAGAPRRVYLIWLPKNGEKFNPERPSEPFSLGRYILPGGITPEG